MSVARTHHTKDYTCMSNYHFKDKSLSLKAKGLLSLMLSLPEQWDYSIIGLSSLSSDGETSVRTAIKELEEHKYLERTPIRENGRIVDWEYDIYEHPKDFLHVENQHVEKSLLENTDNKILKQSNTKELNKKNNSKELLQNQEFSFGKTKIKKDSLYTKCVQLIDSYPFDNEIRNLLIEYLQFRLSIKDKPLYNNMWKGMLSKLRELTNDHGYTDDKLCKAIIKQSIERGYLSFYPIGSYSGIKSESGARNVPRMTEEDYKKEAEHLAELEAQGVQVRF